MQVVTPEFVKGKKVLLRYDMDVALKKGERGKGKGESQIEEDFKLKAGLPTLRLCLENASEVIIIGHLGRPEGKAVPELSVEPIRRWLASQGLSSRLTSGKLKLLENLRFDPREDAADLEYAKELAKMGEVFVNESFSAYRPAASTTVLPTILPAAAGLHFAEEVRVLSGVRENPQKPFVVIMGGAKVADKLSVIKVLAGKADTVLVGGKLVSDSTLTSTIVARNVVVGKLNEAGTDINAETMGVWKEWISKAAMIVWNGPLGRIEENTWKVSKDFTFQAEKLGSAKGTYEIAKMVLNSHAQIVAGGGDTVAFLGSIGMLEEFEKKGFVSVGGGAMLKLLSDGTLPTIEALN